MSAKTTVILGIVLWAAVGRTQEAEQVILPDYGGVRELPRMAVRELGQLPSGVTTTAWNKAHPKDELTVFSGTDGDLADEGTGGWCFRSTVRLDAGKLSRLERRAYFYPPSMPPDGALPAVVRDKTLAMRGCVLGAMRLEARSPQGHDAGLASALVTGISRAHGQGAAESPPQFDAADWPQFWEHTVRWRLGQLRIYAEYDADRDLEVVIAFLPVSGITPEKSGLRKVYDAPYQRTVERIEEAMKVAQAPPPAQEKVREVVRLSRPVIDHPWPKRRLTLEEAVAALRVWLRVTTGMPPERRAAALLVADHTLSLALEELRGQDAENRFAALGARFKGDTWTGRTYEGNWKNEAVKLGLTPRLEDLLFLEQMESGFNTPECGNGTDEFQEVIRRGEVFLSQPHDIDITVRSHFLVAEGHATIVYLGQPYSIYGQDGELKQYLAQAPRARKKALEHYRAGLALDHTSAHAREAWRDAWWLIADLPMQPPRFYCLMD